MLEPKKTDYMVLGYFVLLLIIGSVMLFYGLLFVFSAAGYIAAKLAVAGGDLLAEIFKTNYIEGLLFFVIGLFLFSVGIIGLNKYWKS